MAPSVFWLLSVVAAVAVAQQDNVLDNDLAKICRPLDRSIDVMFILDGSGSNAGEIFETQIRMVNQVVDMVEVGPNKTRVAVLQYSGWSRMEFDFQDHMTKRDVREAVNEITHSSGSTRTGRALDRALNAFGEDYGGRMGRDDVAQVAVVVSDGRSIDDPGTAADRLRKSGVIVMSMGIGHRVFMTELERIAGGDELAFKNETMKEFMDTFRKIAIGEQCDYAKGPNGAEIICKENMIEVNVLTKLPFVGHLYVPNYYDNPKCRTKAQGTDWEPSRTLSLTIPLESCGVQKQFLVRRGSSEPFSPRGLMFETAVTLKYHPKYNSLKDQTFNVRCFYPDMHFSQGEQPTAFTSEEADNAKLGPSFSAPDMLMPCAYKVVQSERGCLMDNSMVGKAITHTWECDRKILGSAYGMLVRSCSMVNDKGTQHEIIDENGCVTDPNVIRAPVYNQLKVSAEGTTVKFADSNDVKFRCSIQFCNIKEGECDKMLPPRCGGEGDASSGNNRRKRQVIQTGLAQALGGHPDMINRLFGSNNHLVQRNGGFKITAMSSQEKANTVKLLKSRPASTTTTTSTSTEPTTTESIYILNAGRAAAAPHPEPVAAAAAAGPRPAAPSGPFSVSVNTFNQVPINPAPQPPAAPAPAAVVAEPTTTSTEQPQPPAPTDPIYMNNISREQREQWRRQQAGRPDETEANVQSGQDDTLHTLQPTPDPVTNAPYLGWLAERSRIEDPDAEIYTAPPVDWTQPGRPVGLEYVQLPPLPPKDKQQAQEQLPVIRETSESLSQDDQILEFVASAEKIAPTAPMTADSKEVQEELSAAEIASAEDTDEFNSTTDAAITSTSTPPPATTTEEKIDMDLQGLAEDILKKLNFMQVDIESQTMQVNAESDFSELESHFKSPVNWCPRGV